MCGCLTIKLQPPHHDKWHDKIPALVHHQFRHFVLDMPSPFAIQHGNHKIQTEN